jgi:hypothetical protein
MSSREEARALCGKDGADTVLNGVEPTWGLFKHYQEAKRRHSDLSIKRHSSWNNNSKLLLSSPPLKY